jgi:hypothetical protein
VHNLGAIIGGVLLGGVGLLLIIGGSLALVSEQALRTVDNAAEGRIPETLRFNAEEARYGVVLFITATDSEANDTRCQVTLANEERKSIRGDIQAVSVSGRSKSVGEFEAVEGSTEITCRLEGRDNDLVSQRFAVAKIHERWRTGALVVIGLGVVVLLLGIWVGFRPMWRKQKGAGQFGGTSRPA